MKANLTLRQDAFERLLPLGTKTPDLRALATRIATQTKLCFKSLSKALHPVSREEAYLAESQNLAELEKRMLELQTHHDGFSSSYW